MSEPLPTRQPSARRVTVVSAFVAFVVVVAAGGAVWAVRTLAPDPSAAAVVSSPSTAVPAAPAVLTTRLAVQGPLRLLDPAAGPFAPGTEAALALPVLRDGTSAVLVEVSLTEAVGPGAVSLRSSVDQTPVLRVGSAGGQTSATVVAAIGSDRELRVVTEGGGRLRVDLVGAFEPADSATSGRIVTLAPTPVVNLTPAEEGHEAAVDLTALPALQGAGPVSAVLLRVAGDVGPRGGLVSVGPSPAELEQTVHWSATAGADRLRPGFLVVPVRSARLHVHYEAGAHLAVDLVGYVTGDGAAESTSGLAVPVPAAAAPPVTVTAAGAVDATVVPAGGLAGLAPDQVAAALVTVEATGDPSAAVAVGAPVASGGGGVGGPDVAATAAGRRALALSPVADGVVGISSSPTTAVVTVTPRVLVTR